MNLNDPLMQNGLRFLSMLLASILIGLLWRWAMFERRRWYMLMGAGISVLSGGQIYGHYIRLNEPLTWVVPVNLIAFAMLIVSFAALQREGSHRARSGTERRKHT